MISTSSPESASTLIVRGLPASAHEAEVGGPVHGCSRMSAHAFGADRKLVRETDLVVGRALVDEGLSVKPPTTHLPNVAALIAEVGDRVLQRVGVYQQQLHVLGEMGHTIAVDISRTTAEIGYVPKVELYEGMRRSIRWCLDQGLEL